MIDIGGARVAIEKAHDHIGALALGEVRWKMSVPARPDTDSDLVLTAGLEAGEKALAELGRLREVAARLAEELEDLSRGTCWKGERGFDACDNGGCVDRRALLDDYRALTGGPS